MDFDRLPNHIGVKILQYLRIDNQIRIAGVNRRFQELSTMAISATTEINLCDLSFMEDADLEKLIRLCAGNLKRITLSGDFRFHGSILKQTIELISQLPLPQLVELDLYDSRIEAETMHQLLINCPNIRRLHVESEKFPSTNTGNSSAVTCGNLESLEIRRCSKNVVNFCIDSCPRLKSLRLSKLRWTGDELVQRLNKIIDKYPDLEQMTLGVGYQLDTIPIESLGSLWRLSSLRSLSLLWLFSVDDQDAINISNRLSQLEELAVFVDVYDAGLTWRVIPPFSGLVNLRQLFVCLPGGITEDLSSFDQGISHLRGHQRLECIKVDFQLSINTVIDLANNCPQLKRLVTRNIVGIDSKLKAKQFVRRLRGFIQEKFTIELVRSWDEQIWLSNTVQSALSRINADSNGRPISIKINRYALSLIEDVMTF